MNGYLNTISNKVHQIQRNLIDDGKQVTAENIKDILAGKGEKKHFILEAFQEHNRQMKALTGQEFAPATLIRYKTACTHLSNYLKWKYGKVDFEIKDLNYEFIAQFVFWLKIERKCGQFTLNVAIEPYTFDHGGSYFFEYLFRYIEVNNARLFPSDIESPTFRSERHNYKRL